MVSYEFLEFRINSLLNFLERYKRIPKILIKGQLISKCPFCVIVWTKIQRKKLTISALEFEKWLNHRIKALYNVFNTLNSPYNDM